MAHYRLFFLNAEGHFMRVEEVDAPGDNEALNKARQLDHAHILEVWEDKRKVGIVGPN